VTTVLDEIPIIEGWTELPIRAVTQKISEVGFGDLEPLSVYLEAGVVPRSSRDDNHNQLGEDIQKYQRVLPNDLVFNKLRTWQGGFGISDYEGIVSPAYIIARPNLGLIDPKFLGYLLKSKPYLAELTRLSKWMPPSQFDISWESIRDIKLRVPSIEKQRLITKFLDRKVGAIEMLIAANKRKLSLLDQARSTTFTNIVLGFAEYSKESAALLEEDEWRKMLPEGWKLLPLKHLVECDNTGIWGEEPGALDIDVSISTTAHLTRKNEFLFSSMPVRSMTSADWLKYKCRPGDIIVVKSSGSADNIMSGKAVLVVDDAPDFTFSNFLLRLRPRNRAYAQYLQAFLTSNITVERIKKMVSTTTYPNLKVEEYLNAQVPFPPLDEIGNLSDKLLQKENQFNMAFGSTEIQIEKLLEYRSALITSTVTGTYDTLEEGAIK